MSTISAAAPSSADDGSQVSASGGDRANAIASADSGETFAGATAAVASSDSSGAGGALSPIHLAALGIFLAIALCIGKFTIEILQAAKILTPMLWALLVGGSLFGARNAAAITVDNWLSSVQSRGLPICVTLVLDPIVATVNLFTTAFEALVPCASTSPAHWAQIIAPPLATALVWQISLALSSLQEIAMAMEAAKSSCMAQWEGGEGEGGEGEEQLEQEQEQDGEQGQYECPDPMSSPTLATVAISVSDAVAAATGFVASNLTSLFVLWFVIFVTAIVCKWKAPSLLAPANLVTGALGFNVVTFIVLPALFHPLLYKVAALGLSIALLSSATGFVGSLIQNNRIWKPLFVGCILVTFPSGVRNILVGVLFAMALFRSQFDLIASKLAPMMKRVLDNPKLRVIQEAGSTARSVIPGWMGQVAKTYIGIEQGIIGGLREKKAMLGSVMVYLFCVGGAAFFAFFCATTVVVETAIVGTHHVATASKLGGSVWGSMEPQIVPIVCEYEHLAPWKGFSQRAIGFIGATEDNSIMDMRESFYEAVYDLSASNEGQEVCKPCDMTILQLDHQRDLTEWLHGHVYETLIKGYVREQVSPDFDFEQVEEMVAKVANSVERYGAKHQADAGQEGEAGWSITGLYQTIADDLSAPADGSSELEDDGNTSDEDAQVASPFDQMKDFALSFFDGDSGAQLADYANVAMEHGIQFATTVSRGVTATVLALATIGEAAKTYLVFSGIVLFILSLPGNEYAPAAFALDCLLFGGRKRQFIHSELIESLESIFIARARAAAFFFLWTWLIVRLSGAHAFVTTLPWALIAAAAAAVQIFPVYMGVILPVLALLAAQNWVSAIVLMVGSVFSTNQLLAMFGGKNKDEFLKGVVTCGSVAIMGLPGAILGPSLLVSVGLVLKMWYIMIEDVTAACSNQSPKSGGEQDDVHSHAQPQVKG